MPAKLTYEYVKQKIKDISGYVLISSVYLNSKTKMKMICDQGHNIEMHFNAITNGDRCHVCANRIPITLERINNMCNDKELILITCENIGWEAPLLVKCNRDHTFITAYKSLKNHDVKCDECFQRTCRSCNLYLTLEEMEKKSNAANGRTRICKKCSNKYKNEKSKTPEGRERRRKQSTRYRIKNREKVNKLALDWRNKHKEEVNIKQKENRNKNLEERRRKDREKFQNPKRKTQHKINQAERRTRKLKATPSWLTIEQKQEIANIYINCPIGYHVDHIEPLRGKEVCGLHVPWNMQYLPALENIQNGNRRKKPKLSN